MYRRFLSLLFRSPRVAVALGVLGVLCLGAAGAHAQQARPLPSSDTTRIGFDQAIRTALDQNTDLKRAQASVRQSETQVQAEWMDFAPDLSLSTDLTRRVGRNFSQVTGNFTTRSTDFFNVGGRSSITLFNGFENMASLNQARNQAEADDLSLQRTRREVVFTVMNQYISLIESREIVRVRREELEARRQQLRQIEEFVDAGSRPVSDLYQEQANVAEAEQRLLQAEREREVSKTRLIQTLQLNPRRAYRFAVPDLAADTLSTERYDLGTLMDRAFEERLDLRAAEAERQAAEKGIRSARSSYYPTLTLSGRYGTDWTSRGRIPDPDNPNQFIEPSFGDQLDNNRGGGLSLSLNIPIFDRLQRNTQVERAQVQAQNAQYQLEDQRQQVALQVRQAYLDYRNAVQQLEAANKRLRAARQARAAAQERYNLGSASIVELQNATRDFVDAASQQVRARYNLIFQKKQIDYQVGRLRPTEPLIRQPDAQ
jgi:outer membrane protein